MSWKAWGDHPLFIALSSVAIIVGLVSTVYNHYHPKDVETPVTISNPPFSSPPVTSPPVTSSPAPLPTISSPPSPTPSDSPSVSSPEPAPSVSVVKLEPKNCIMKTGTGGLISSFAQGKDISIGKQIFTSSFKMGYIYGWAQSISLLTCKVPEGHKSLQLKFGREDGDENNYMDGRGTSTITVYINGDPAPSQFIKSGEQKSVNFNISERDSIAIEFRCRTNTGCGDVHFFDATFYDHHFNMNPNPVSPTSSAQPQPTPTIIPASQNPKTPSINLTSVVKKDLNITDLLSMTCLNTGEAGWHQKRDDVPVGKNLYVSMLHMSPNLRGSSGRVGITCKLSSTESRTKAENLKLDFGVSDNDINSIINQPDNPSTIIIYLNGEKASSKIIGKGKIESISLNIKEAKSVGIETFCPKRYCVNVEFFDLSLTQ
ncbi:hypothetical protein [Microcoleus sp. CAWBG58]|uniref:hypothetical protein n=1 Tax=Microcoleus sp. CAWBG58 TaxID=2841651 RepID=UPI0025E8467D|nr:hypothetical protein [Microcoleus sp. CAWBG58]